MNKPRFCGKDLNMKLVFFVVWCMAVVNGQCPSGCFCYDGYVSCFSLKRVPTSFPLDTSTIAISNMVADEIQSRAFSDLPSLKSIEIYYSNITSFSSGAFSDLETVEFISLNELRIETIESGAFSNLTNNGKLSIYMSEIGSIRTQAFDDIYAMEEINIFMSKISKIETSAFHNIDEIFKFNFYSNNVTTMEAGVFQNATNTYRFSMYLNTFKTFGCYAVDEIIADSYEVSFYSNTVSCSCEISWVMKSDTLKKHLIANKCISEDRNTLLDWSELAVGDLQCGSKGIDDVCPDFTEQTAAHGIDKTSMATPVTTKPQTVNTDNISTRVYADKDTDANQVSTSNTKLSPVYTKTSDIVTKSTLKLSTAQRETYSLKYTPVGINNHKSTFGIVAIRSSTIKTNKQQHSETTTQGQKNQTSSVKEGSQTTTSQSTEKVEHSSTTQRTTSKVLVLNSTIPSQIQNTTLLRKTEAVNHMLTTQKKSDEHRITKEPTDATSKQSVEAVTVSFGHSQNVNSSERTSCSSMMFIWLFSFYVKLL